MKLVTTTCDFDAYTKNDYLQSVKYGLEAGFKHFDLNMYKPLEGDAFFGDNWEKAAFNLKNETEKLGVDFLQAHSPDTNNMAGQDGFEDAVSKTARALEVCGVLGIPNLVCHAGYDKNVADKKIWFEENKKFYSALFPVMEKTGVNLLCENTTKANMPSWYYLITGGDMREFCKYVGHPLFHACWDTGHANCEGSQYQEIMNLGDELYAIHFNDNRGKADEHMIPFLGTMNSGEVMTALFDVGFKGPFTLECSSSLRPKQYWHGNRRDFPRDDRLDHVPLVLVREMEKVMYAAGKYILEKYDCFED